jgi:hypothetical protein
MFKPSQGQLYKLLHNGCPIYKPELLSFDTLIPHPQKRKEILFIYFISNLLLSF